MNLTLAASPLAALCMIWSRKIYTMLEYFEAPCTRAHIWLHTRVTSGRLGAFGFGPLGFFTRTTLYIKQPKYKTTL
jgi:hypothetical protein